MDSNNVVKFPKAKRSVPALQVDGERIRATVPKTGSVIKKTFAWIWLIIRLPIFLVMYWLRMPVIFLCNLISIPMLLAWLFAWYAFPEKTNMVWAFGTVSFLAFVISWTYDFILMAISPQDMMRAL